MYDLLVVKTGYRATHAPSKCALFSGNFIQQACVTLSMSVPSSRYYPYNVVAACQVYPIGIPVLYAFILWKNRALLNPSIDTQSVGDDGDVKPKLSPKKLQEHEEKIKARRDHPDLVPSMFLWKDFGKVFKGP